LGVPINLVYLDLGGTVVELISYKALLSSHLHRLSIWDTA
jgi:hypothetical protein